MITKLIGVRIKELRGLTGESQELGLDAVPEWVDAVYSVGLLLTQYNNYGIYHNGFLNAITEKVDVTSIANGYGNFAQDGDLYVCAGISEVDESRTTESYFVVNQRTKDTAIVKIGGADEQAAQTAALELVGKDSSIASYPVMMNIDQVPTYSICVMGEDYAFKELVLLDLEDPSRIAGDKDVEACLQGYHQAIQGAKTAS